MGLERDQRLHDLFVAQYESLVRLAALLVDDRSNAEEVAQDAFVRLHRSWSKLRDPDAAPAYLRSSVMNIARSRLRRLRVARRHTPRSSVDAAPAEERAIEREEGREVLALLRALPRRQKECLALRFYLDLSEAEIAETLGVSKGSVKSHTHRGLAALAEKLEEDR